MRPLCIIYTILALIGCNKHPDEQLDTQTINDTQKPIEACNEAFSNTMCFVSLCDKAVVITEFNAVIIEGEVLTKDGVYNLTEDCKIEVKYPVVKIYQEPKYIPGSNWWW